MKNLKPKRDWIQLNVEDTKVGKFDTSSVKSGNENAIIVAIGPDVQDKTLKVGQKVMYAAWAIELKLYEGKTYHFISESRNGIVAEIV